MNTPKKGLLVVQLLLCFSVSFYLTAAQMVRQCTCGEVQACRAQKRQQMQSCLQQCRSQRLGADASSECFSGMHHGDGQGGCFQGLGDQMCANVPGTMMDASETFQPGMFKGAAGGMGGGRGLFAGRLGGASGGSGGANSGRQHGQCFQQCAQQLGVHAGGCAQSLGCALRRPPQEAMMSVMMQCRMEHQSRRAALCQCLQRFGRGHGQFCEPSGGGMGAGGMSPFGGAMGGGGAAGNDE
ncbi:hypothetical protein DdX_17868 [Ditylenchus destructor]|uniref:Uncharacterized protein n=1 Tax=Ditylenchus destructor TaxID=166010 RepID=A0AAD4MLS7_9BILA|nr:hypothetical protein DdX_17868 [Ditylenchus destructor]